MFESAAEYARECNRHNSTVTLWIKQGRIKAAKGHKPKTHYKIYEKEQKKIKDLKTPYPKYYKRYSDIEKYIILNNKHLSNDVLAKMLKRSKNSVCIKRCRMRKQGYDI